MQEKARLFLEMEIGRWDEIGAIEDCGSVDFHTKKSIFRSDQVSVKPIQLLKSRPKKSIKKAESITQYGAIALLVSPVGDSKWSEEINHLGKERRNFRVVYADGETHTLDCIALMPGKRPPNLHIQLYICAAPLIENRCAAIGRELQAHWSDLNSPW